MPRADTITRGWQKTRQLRNGYTTGTCAAAAAAAAAWHAFTGREKGQIRAELPGGGLARLEAFRAWEDDGTDWFYVKKDAGDDPDVTNGVLVYGAVERLNLKRKDSVPEERERPLPPWYSSKEYPFLFLTGGPGIGVVTRQGLACPAGYYAINPTPRDMIFKQVGQLYRELDMEGEYLIRIKIPQGEALADRTFNPRLGIRGGISVLGTSGIVRPMSEQALKDTIRLEIHMKAAEGHSSLILLPGSYGERFLKETLGISPEWGVQCSNFAADAIRMAVDEGMKRILFIGHVGKLVKVAGGAENTHSKYGDRRLETLAESLERTEMGGAAREELKKKILGCATTEEALEHLTRQGLRDVVMEDITEKIWRQMNQWAQGRADIQVLTFSSVYGILGMSSLCGPAIKEWREKQI